MLLGHSLRFCSQSDSCPHHGDLDCGDGKAGRQDRYGEFVYWRRRSDCGLFAAGLGWVEQLVKLVNLHFWYSFCLHWP